MHIKYDRPRTIDVPWVVDGRHVVLFPLISVRFVKSQVNGSLTALLLTQRGQALPPKISVVEL